MALRKGSDGETEEFHSISGDGLEDDEDDGGSELMEPPTHPVRSMQSAFEESIFESGEDSDAARSTSEANAEVRRQQLLDSKQYDGSWHARWKQKPTARHHPLLKLMAQIVFGMHLLQQQQAKSEDEVVKILQTHVNEMDTFVERSSEDFDLAINDIEERIRFLKLPMVHQDVFEIMLDDKKFRTQLLDGNDKIEKIIDRTSKALNASLFDIQKGIEANKELGKYLGAVQEYWPKENRAISEVYGAMRGNEHGWTKYLQDLQVKGSNLKRNLVQLGTLLGEMSKLAAAASRRNKTQSKSVQPGSSSSTSSTAGLRSKFSNEPQSTVAHPPRTASLNKPLPKEPPDAAAGAPRGTMKPHPVPFAERYEQPRQTPLSPRESVSRPTTRPSREQEPPRPRTAGARMTPREARPADSRGNTSELAEFLKINNPHHNPLRSNPPNPLRSNPPDGRVKTPVNGTPEKKFGRSQSQGASAIMNATPPVSDSNAGMSRSRSQGAMDVFKAVDNKFWGQPSTRVEDSKAPAPSSVRKGPLHR